MQARTRAALRRRQEGVSLGGLLVTSFFVIIVALLLLKVVPAYIEYGTLRKITQAVVQDPGLKNATLTDVKGAYNRRASVDNIDVINVDDLDITKEDDKLVIAFAYSKKIPLFANVSLVIDFESTAKQ